MKKIGLGIALLLFSILFRMCSQGLELISLLLGGIGLLYAIWGAVEKNDAN